jgi:peptide/nickel transport system substrate-binding protein
VSHKAAAGLTRETANEAFNTGKAAIGTGPFKFVSWTPKSELVLERFPGYWRGPAAWERVVRKEIPNDPARVAQLKAGQVDMIVRVPAADVPTLKRDPKINVVTADTIYVFNVELDQREKSPQVSAKDGSALPNNPLRDPRVREAMSLAIDRPALAEVALEGLGKPATQNVTPGIFGYDNKLPEMKPNLQRARQLLTEAGYPNGFRIVFSFTNDRLPGDRAVGTSIAQMLARVGIEVQANAQPTAVFFPARTRGEFSMIMAGWGTLTGESHYTLTSLMQTQNAQARVGAFNWRGSSNPEMDKLLDQAGVELDEKKREELLKQAMNLSMKDHYVIPTVIVGTAWAMQKDKVAMPKPRADEDTLAYDLKPVK